MQTAGLGATKVLVLVGAGLTGSVVLGNSKIADLLSDLSKVFLKHSEKVKDGGAGEQGETTAALTRQIEKLARELQKLANSRPIVVNSGGGAQSAGPSFATVAVPAVVIGAAGYGYLWWRGISFASIMYVTRNQMSTAVASVSKQLGQVYDALAVAKKQLSARLDFVTKTLDESMTVQSVIKDQVIEVRGEVEKVGQEIETVQRLVEGLELKIDEVQGKQDFGNQGIVLLCQFVSQQLEGGQRTQLLQGIQTYSGSRLERTASSPALPNAGLKELQFISEQLSGSASTECANGLAVETPQRLSLPRPYLPAFRATRSLTRT